MWIERYTQASYITVTAHYITNDWNLVERVLSTGEFDPELRHTSENIKIVLETILTDFNINASKTVFVTDRGANVLAAMKDSKHLSCCDHMTNTVLRPANNWFISAVKKLKLAQRFISDAFV